MKEEKPAKYAINKININPLFIEDVQNTKKLIKHLTLQHFFDIMSLLKQAELPLSPYDEDFAVNTDIVFCLCADAFVSVFLCLLKNDRRELLLAGIYKSMRKSARRKSELLMLKEISLVLWIQKQRTVWLPIKVLTLL